MNMSEGLQNADLLVSQIGRTEEPAHRPIPTRPPTTPLLAVRADQPAANAGKADIEGLYDQMLSPHLERPTCEITPMHCAISYRAEYEDSC